MEKSPTTLEVLLSGQQREQEYLEGVKNQHKHHFKTKRIVRLSYLHLKKIVHRDVTIENTLLDKRRTLRIADFELPELKLRTLIT